MSHTFDQAPFLHFNNFAKEGEREGFKKGKLRYDREMAKERGEGARERALKEISEIGSMSLLYYVKHAN